MSRTMKLLTLNWPRTRECSQLLQTGNWLLTFLTMVTLYVHVLLGQKLTSEFMLKIYAASWKLFTDSWNWRSFVYKRCEAFNCLFSTGCTKWNTDASKILKLFMVGLFIGVSVEKCAACQSHRTSDFGWIASTHFPILHSYYTEGSKKSQAILMVFRSILTGKPEILDLIWFFFSGFLKSSVVSAPSL